MLIVIVILYYRCTKHQFFAIKLEKYVIKIDINVLVFDLYCFYYNIIGIAILFMFVFEYTCERKTKQNMALEINLRNVFRDFNPRY